MVLKERMPKIYTKHKLFKKNHHEITALNLKIQIWEPGEESCLLNKTAPQYLCIPATWTYSEKSFSSAGFTSPNCNLFNTFAAGVQIYHTLKCHMSHYFHATLQLHNSPDDCARDLFKPSKDSACLRICHEKKIWVLGFSDVTKSSEVGFWPFWLMLPGLGPNH